MKRITIGVTVFLLLLVTAAYILLKYRIKNVVEYAVQSASKGAYKLTMQDVSFSFSDAVIEIKDATLSNVIKKDTGTAYGATIPSLFIRLKGWMPLVSDKKIALDSLYLDNAVLQVFEGRNQRARDTSKSFSFSSLAGDLDKALLKLEVNKLAVQNARIIYRFKDATKNDFVIDKINFAIRNFTKSTDQKKRFLSSDDIDLSLGKQSFKLPNTTNEFRFSNLHFSGRQQYFEIDSFGLKTYDDANNSPVNFEAERLLFSATDLTALYMKDRLLVDTLVCKHPVLHLRTTEKQHTKDSVRPLSVLNKLFDNIHFNYIAVTEGQLSLEEHHPDKQLIYTTEKTNLQLFDLDLAATNKNFLSLGNIALELDTIQFYTPDSLYVLNVDGFSILNNDLICTNASFVPGKKTTASGGMQLSLPRFILKNIDIAGLLQKKLKADYALFNAPEIYVQGSGKKQLPDSVKKPKGIDGVYKSLHGFNNLIDVDSMFVTNGNLHFAVNTQSGVSVDATDFNAAIKLKELFESDSLIDIKRSLSNISFGKLLFSSTSVKAIFDQISIQGALQENHVKKAGIKLSSGLKLQLDGVIWKKLDWDKLYNNGAIDAGSISFNSIKAQYNQLQQKAAGKKILPVNINGLSIGNLDATIRLLNGSNITTKGKAIRLDTVTTGGKGLAWHNIVAALYETGYSKDETHVTAKEIRLDKKNGSVLKDINVHTAQAVVSVPEIKLHTDISGSNLSNLNLQYLVINNPAVEYTAGATSKSKHRRTGVPVNISTGVLQVNNASFTYKSSPQDSVIVHAFVNINIDSLVTDKESARPIQYHTLKASATNTVVSTKKLRLQIPALNAALSNTIIEKQHDSKLRMNTAIALEWNNSSVELKRSAGSVLAFTNISGNLAYDNLQPGKKLKRDDLAALLQSLELSGGSMKYNTNTTRLSINNVAWNGKQSSFKIEGLGMTPLTTRDTFFNQLQWQKDYMSLTCDTITLAKIDVKKYLKDSAVNIDQIAFTHPVLVTSRDKNIPFQHGIEKLMPTKLIQKIKTPLQVNKLVIKDAAITANEISATTKKEGSITLAEINAEINHITNRPVNNDSLHILANANLLNHYIRHLQYKESYADSLSGFRMTMKMSPMDLTVLNKITYPLAAVSIHKGKSDTLYERIAGNKYAAYGKIKFYYKDLNVQMMNKKDSSHKTFLLSLENFVANKFVVKTKNRKDAKIFFIRDPEKFVFNYWIKSTFSGVMSSAGIKRSKKYEKKYKSIQAKYTLPAIDIKE